MIIRQVKQTEKDNWDAYVQNHPETSPYHLWAWKRSIEEAYGHKAYCLIAEEGDNICGVLPIIHMKLPLLQNQFVALPFCDEGHPLADNPEIVSQLLQKAQELAKKLGVQLLEIRARKKEHHDNHQHVTDKEASNTSKVSMLLKLPDSSEALWNVFKSKLRSQVRKAEKNGLTFKWGQLVDINVFYEVFSRNMHDLGSPVHSKKWIKSVLNSYGEHAKMGLVYLGQTPIGCGVILCCDRTVSIPWASTLRTHNRLGPNMLLYWHFLHFSAENGYAIFDFGRSTPGEGTYRFKAQWGAVPTPLVWRTITPNESTPPINLSDTSNPNYRKLAEKTWQKLPLGLANILGPTIRKHISL